MQALRTVTDSAPGDVTSQTTSLGATAVAGDLIVAVVLQGATNANSNAPSGYIKLGSSLSGSVGGQTDVHYKVATGGETSFTTTIRSAIGWMRTKLYLFQVETTVDGLETFETSSFHDGNDTAHIRNGITNFPSPVRASFAAHTVGTPRIGGAFAIGVVIACFESDWNAGFLGGAWVSNTTPAAYTEGDDAALGYGPAGGTGRYSATHECVVWDGYQLAATSEPAEDFDLNHDDGVDLAMSLGRFVFPYSFTVVQDINQNRYTQRRFIGTSLPYDLVTIRLGGE